MANDPTTDDHGRICALAYVRPAEVLVREVGDELVVLNTASEQYHSLNAMGRQCYELLIAGSDVEQTVAAICAEYDVDAERAHADLVALIAELLESGLLRATA